MLYRFYWNEGESLIEIKEMESEIEELLDKYREANEDDYNIDGFILFLKGKGIIAHESEAVEIYF